MLLCAKEIVAAILTNLLPEYYGRECGKPKADFLFYSDLEYSRFTIKSACDYLVEKEVILAYKMLEDTLNIYYTVPAHLLMFYNDCFPLSLKDPLGREWGLRSFSLTNLKSLTPTTQPD